MTRTSMCPCLMDFTVDEIESVVLILPIVSRASNTYYEVD